MIKLNYYVFTSYRCKPTLKIQQTITSVSHGDNKWKNISQPPMLTNRYLSNALLYRVPCKSIKRFHMYFTGMYIIEKHKVVCGCEVEQKKNDSL